MRAEATSQVYRRGSIWPTLRIFQREPTLSTTKHKYNITPRWTVKPYRIRGINISLTRSIELATLLPLTVIQEDTLSQIQGDTFRIRRASLEATPELPAFFVGYETANNKIIVSVRGTASLQDALTNLKLDTEPFMGGYAHAGMACPPLVALIVV